MPLIAAKGDRCAMRRDISPRPETLNRVPRASHDASKQAEEQRRDVTTSAASGSPLTTSQRHPAPCQESPANDREPRGADTPPMAPPSRVGERSNRTGRHREETPNGQVQAVPLTALRVTSLAVTRCSALTHA